MASTAYMTEDQVRDECGAIGEQERMFTADAYDEMRTEMTWKGSAYHEYSVGLHSGSCGLPTCERSALDLLDRGFDRGHNQHFPPNSQIGQYTTGILQEDNSPLETQLSVVNHPSRRLTPLNQFLLILDRCEYSCKIHKGRVFTRTVWENEHRLCGQQPGGTKNKVSDNRTKLVTIGCKHCNRRFILDARNAKYHYNKHHPEMPDSEVPFMPDPHSCRVFFTNSALKILN